MKCRKVAKHYSDGLVEEKCRVASRGENKKDRGMKTAHPNESGTDSMVQVCYSQQVETKWVVTEMCRRSPIFGPLLIAGKRSQGGKTGCPIELRSRIARCMHQYCMPDIVRICKCHAALADRVIRSLCEDDRSAKYSSKMRYHLATLTSFGPKIGFRKRTRPKAEWRDRLRCLLRRLYVNKSISLGVRRECPVKQCHLCFDTHTINDSGLASART